jgi:four helix bundle protein
MFVLADGLTLRVYRATSTFPTGERYGLQAQIRRAAVSVATNIVEGSARPSTADYCRFLAISAGSADETGYLLQLSSRLGFLDPSTADPIADAYSKISAGLINAMSRLKGT